MGAHELSALLWKERELLELLVFKLEEEQLLLTAGKSRWLQHATREVEQVMERLRSAGFGRAVEITELAKEWKTESDDPTLRDLVSHAPDGPWGEIFAAHLKAMTELTTEIKELRDVNEQFLRAALRSSQKTLAGINPDAGTYDSHGASGSSTGGAARFFDKSL